eukprot:3063554-Amphidinium_carterae.1
MDDYSLNSYTTVVVNFHTFEIHSQRKHGVASTLPQNCQRTGDIAKTLFKFTLKSRVLVQRKSKKTNDGNRLGADGVAQRFGSYAPQAAKKHMYTQWLAGRFRSALR